MCIGLASYKFTSTILFLRKDKDQDKEKLNKIDEG